MTASFRFNIQKIAAFISSDAQVTLSHQKDFQVAMSNVQIKRLRLVVFGTSDTC